MTEPFKPNPTPLSSLAGSSVRGDLRFSAKAAEHELAREQLRHDLAQVAKDNAQRRLAFTVVLVILIAVLGVTMTLAILSSNDTSRAWAQGLVSTIMGGLVGGVAGYFTGKSSR